MLMVNGVGVAVFVFKQVVFMLVLVLLVAIWAARHSDLFVSTL